MTKPPFLAVKNFAKFQHYQDRAPVWIKLHVALLDDLAFAALTEKSQLHLIKIWLLAARLGHPLPNDPRLIAARIGVKSVAIGQLLTSGFLIEVSEQSASKPASNLLAKPEQNASEIASTRARPPAHERREEVEKRREEAAGEPAAIIGLSANFEDATHRAAYLSYRRAHAMPDGMDAGVKSVNIAMTGGQAYDWPTIGLALVHMRAKQVKFGIPALRSFCAGASKTSTSARGGGSFAVDRSKWKSDLCEFCVATTDTSSKRVRIIHAADCPAGGAAAA